MRLAVLVSGSGTILQVVFEAGLPVTTRPPPAGALAAGVPETGCTVHLATLEMDAGPILAQASTAGGSGHSWQALETEYRKPA